MPPVLMAWKNWVVCGGGEDPCSTDEVDDDDEGGAMLAPVVVDDEGRCLVGETVDREIMIVNVL